MAIQWKPITECEAFGDLQRLAGEPFDLSGDGSLCPERLGNFICKGQEFDLLYACQRLTDEVVDGLQALADECDLVAQFRQMRRGAVMNRIEGYPSEERQVLHTASRDITNENPACPPATEEARRELEKLKAFLGELEDGTVCNEKGERFTTLIHIGIGGSDLGPRSIYEALRCYQKPGHNVHFISNVDPDDSAAVLGQVDLATSLVLVVSKSGTTLETLSNETLVREALREAGLDPARHCLAVTGELSPMDNPQRYLRSFYMVDYIGGRFSSTSMVGAVMLGFALGYDHLLDFLRGANLMDESAENNELRTNLPLLAAMIGVWNHTFLGMGSVAVLPYSQGLHRFPAHLQQCDMESNGKSVQRSGEPLVIPSGPLVWGEPGTNGQHAFYQLLHQGTEKVAVEFIGFRKSQRQQDRVIQGTSSQEKLVANLLAQAMALAVGRDSSNPNRRFPGNRVSTILIADQLTPKSMGALLALYEAKIVFQGFCWNVNSFDQEGVQLGKKLATEILTAVASQEDADSLASAFLRAAGMA